MQASPIVFTLMKSIKVGVRLNGIYDQFLKRVLRILFFQKGFCFRSHPSGRSIRCSFLQTNRYREGICGDVITHRLSTPFSYREIAAIQIFSPNKNSKIEIGQNRLHTELPRQRGYKRKHPFVIWLVPVLNVSLLDIGHLRKGRDVAY